MTVQHVVALVCLLSSLTGGLVHAQTTTGTEFEVYTDIVPSKVALEKQTLFQSTTQKLANKGRLLYSYGGGNSEVDNTVQVAGGDANGLLAAVQAAWVGHYDLSLSPDHIWLAIMQGLAMHVNANAEELRSEFVSFEGKETISVVVTNVPRTDAQWQSVFNRFSGEINSFIGNETYEMIKPSFSTTGPLEQAVTSIVLMDALQAFFKYILIVSCGIPKVTLQGTPADWKKLRDNAAKLEKYGLKWWTDELIPVLDEFVNASTGTVNIDFWKGIYAKFDGAYMMDPSISGWILVFFPYFDKPIPKVTPGLEFFFGNRTFTAPDKKENRNTAMGTYKAGRSDASFYGTGGYRGNCGYMPGVAIWDLPKGLSSAPVLVTGMGEDFNVKFVGGFVGVQQDPVTLAISPQIGYAVVFDPDLPLPSTGFLEENFPVPTESLPKPATAPTCLDMQQNGVEDGIDCQNADAVTGVRQLCPLCGCVSLWGTGNALLDGSSFIKSHPYYPYYAVYQQETTIAGASLTLRISSYEHVDQWVLYFLQDGVETALFVSQYKGINQIHGMYTALPQTGVTLRDEAGKAITRLQVNHQCNAFNNRTMIDAAIIPQCVVVVRDELVMPSNLAGGQTAVDYRPVYQRYMLVNNLNTAEYGLYYGYYQGETNDHVVIRISMLLEPINSWSVVDRANSTTFAIDERGVNGGVAALFLSTFRPIATPGGPVYYNLRIYTCPETSVSVYTGFEYPTNSTGQLLPAGCSTTDDGLCHVVNCSQNNQICCGGLCKTPPIPSCVDTAKKVCTGAFSPAKVPFDAFFEPCKQYPCTTDECCDVNPSCLESAATVCVDGLTPRFNLTGQLSDVPCQGPSCSPHECCISPSCFASAATLCVNGFSPSADLNTAPCQDVKCTKQECCIKHPNCLDFPFACPGSSIRAPNPGPFCADPHVCLSGECCVLKLGPGECGGPNFVSCGNGIPCIITSTSQEYVTGICGSVLTVSPAPSLSASSIVTTTLLFLTCFLALLPEFEKLS